MRDFSIVVAVDAQGGIGKAGGLPWHLPGDMKYFRELTSAAAAGKINAVIMGRTTWESIPEKFRPLAQRLNVVLTRRTDIKYPEGVLSAQDFPQAFKMIEHTSHKKSVDKIFVIGGAQVFRAALGYRECKALYVTEISQSFPCDTYFPDYKLDFERSHASEPQKDGPFSFRFCTYRRKVI